MSYLSFFGCKVFKNRHEKIGLAVTVSPIFFSNMFIFNVYRLSFFYNRLGLIGKEEGLFNR